MKFSLTMVGALLVTLLAAASPTPTASRSIASSITTASPSSTTPPARVDDNLNSLGIYGAYYTKPEEKPFSLSLDIPANTCTPGNSAYATPSLNGYVPAEACNANWLYFPNFAIAIAFSILFGVLTVAHICQAVIYRNAFCWVVTMAAFWETGAYVSRAVGSKFQQSSGIATVAQILVLVAPIWVNAFAYMVFARMVNFYSPTRRVWIFSPSILALAFVTLDIVSFVIQLVGGGMAGPGSSAESQKKGLNIYMGGIGMQEGFIILFLGLVMKFHYDQLQAEKDGRLREDKITGWRWLIWALYGCLLAITIRIVYRLVEFSAGLGNSNPLPSNEPLLYVLESSPMWLAILVWNIAHPGRFIHGEDAKMPPSWLSRLLCCSCCCSKRRSKDRDGDLGQTNADQRRIPIGPYSALDDDHELQPVPNLDNRDRALYNPAYLVSDTTPGNTPPTVSASEELRLRAPIAVGNDRGVSPEPPSYAPYQSYKL